MRRTSSATERKETAETGFLVLLRLGEPGTAEDDSHPAALPAEHRQQHHAALLGAAGDVLSTALRVESIHERFLLATAQVGVLPNPAVLLDLVEESYGAFGKKQRRIEESLNCDCSACRDVSALRFSAILHYGRWTRVTGIGRAHCHGTDVALAHLVSTGCSTEPHSCMLLTTAALDRMGVDAESAGMCPRDGARGESLATQCVALELEHTREHSNGAGNGADPEDVMLSLDVVIPVSMTDAWDWMTAPDKRTLWEDVDTITTYPRPDRRPGEGTRYHSQQGRHVDEVYEIIDWKPFSRWTWDRHRRGMTVRSTVVLSPAQGGTRVISRFGTAPGAGAVQRMIARREIRRKIARRRSAALERLRKLLEVERTAARAKPSFAISDGRPA